MAQNTLWIKPGKKKTTQRLHQARRKALKERRLEHVTVLETQQAGLNHRGPGPGLHFSDLRHLINKNLNSENNITTFNTHG